MGGPIDAKGFRQAKECISCIHWKSNGQYFYGWKDSEGSYYDHEVPGQGFTTVKVPYGDCSHPDSLYGVPLPYFCPKNKTTAPAPVSSHSGHGNHLFDHLKRVLIIIVVVAVVTAVVLWYLRTYQGIEVNWDSLKFW